MTRRVALIGRPLRRRHSEVMHNAAFDHFGIDARYELRDVSLEQVPGFVDEARGADWLGFQVTTPHKRIVMELLDQIEHDAGQIGAVNTVLRREDGSLAGHNTDAEGFRRAVENELELGLSDLSVCVGGAGGAARAGVHALVVAGAGDITVGNRTWERARALAEDFGPSVRGAGFGAAFDEALTEADLAVNATTVGMIEPGVAFDVGSLPPTAAVFDLVYDPSESELLRRARARGLRVANGLGMLVSQAEIAFERWTGVADAGPVMRAALESL